MRGHCWECGFLHFSLRANSHHSPLLSHNPPPASSLCCTNRMLSLAWRPYLGPAVLYLDRQGNGRLAFCQSWLLEMQNMIPIQPLHLPLAVSSITHPPPCAKLPAMKLYLKTALLLLQARFKEVCPLNQWTVPSLSEHCGSLQPPMLSLFLNQTR